MPFDGVVMGDIRRIDFSPDEWIAGIAGLAADEQGIYWLICSLIYSTGGPIRCDDQRLKALAGCHWRRREAIIAKLILIGKVTSQHGHVDVKRCSRELHKAAIRLAQARHAGQKGGRPKDIEKPAGYARGSPYARDHYQPSTTTTKNLLEKGEGLEAPAAPAPTPEATAVPGGFRQVSSLIAPMANGHDPPPKRNRAAERQRRRDLLVQKLYRFINATMTGDEAMQAGLGLMADDKAEAQRWLDTLDRTMRRAKWSDTGPAH